jgi:hypothetical protein
MNENTEIKKLIIFTATKNLNQLVQNNNEADNY